LKQVIPRSDGSFAYTAKAMFCQNAELKTWDQDPASEGGVFADRPKVARYCPLSDSS